jgi:hypothetical protein
MYGKISTEPPRPPGEGVGIARTRRKSNSVKEQAMKTTDSILIQNSKDHIERLRQAKSRILSGSFNQDTIDAAWRILGTIKKYEQNRRGGENG